MSQEITIIYINITNFVLISWLEKNETLEKRWKTWKTWLKGVV